MSRNPGRDARSDQEVAPATGSPFRLDGMTGLYGRVLKIRASDLEASSREPWGQVALSAGAKRRRIVEEARSAVLDRIRRAR